MPGLYRLYDIDMPGINGHFCTVRPMQHDQADYCCCDC
jgi:hypothetical protein